MCGFCGVYDASGRNEIDQGVIRRMSALMRERGPDAEGFYFDRHIGLGHRRLTIIDLSAGEQPVFNEDRSVLVVFNGEIFNYRELRAQLEQQGHTFRTATDTEVIVHAYEQYGESCVDHFRGMFAFAIHDRRDGSLFLARDRLGIKPLYYTRDADGIRFASEIKPLLLTRGGVAEPDPAAIDFFVSVGYVPGERTLFKGIQKLLPGHWMRWQRGQSAPVIRRYWDVPATPVSDLRPDEALERFGELLRESVRLRMISDVPLGAFLSGGVDSSVIVAQMQELSSQPVKTFSIGYADSAEHNELPFARAVADHLGTDHVEHVLTHGDFFDNIDAFVLRAEEPIVESAGIALFHLARRARQDVTVVLSGEGGDEILAGYPLYQIMGKVDRVRRFAAPTGASALGRLAGRWIASEKAVKYLDWIASPLAARYQGISNDVTPTIRGRMYASDFAQRIGTGAAGYYTELFNRLPDASALKRMSYVDLKTWLPDDLLIKADKMTMAASVELRVPLLDHKLVEFCLSLPDSLRLNGSIGKYLLKQTALRWLPERIVHRKKQGFPVPVSMWFRTGLYDQVSEVLLDRRSLERGYFNPAYIRNILARHRSGAADNSRRILTLVILELWHRNFVDGVCAPIRDLDAAPAIRTDVGVRVLLLTNLFPTSSDPNRGLFTAQLAAAMQPHCELRVMVPLPWTPQGPLAAGLLPARYREFALAQRRMRIHGIEVEYPRYPLLPKISGRWHPALMRAGLRRPLARLRRTFPFDVILCHWLYPDGIAAVDLGRELGVPVVVTGLGCDVNEYLFDAGKRAHIMSALENSAAITVVSQELADVLAKVGIAPRRVTVIPNGVDTQRFHPASREQARTQLGLEPDRPLVACVSRLSHEKGVHVLVEATADLVKLRPDASVVVVGDGPERAALAARIDTAGIGKSIRLVGAVPHGDVATWLTAADIACMPSLREGHPNAAMEAIASGRPLVASRVGALSSMIDDTLGLLVPAGDAAALAKALDDALARRWDEAAIAQAVAGSSWSNAARGYLDVLTAHVDRVGRAA